MAFLEPLIVAGEAAGEAGAAAGEAGAAAGEAGAAAGEDSELGEGGRELQRQGSEPAQRVNKPHVKITKVQDHTDVMLRVLKAFERQRVLVGIPGSKSPRKDGRLNNATIGMIMEKGSPGANIPARPWLAPGIDSGRERIIMHYEAAVKRAFKHGDVGALEAAHNRVGAEAVAAVRRYVRGAGHFVPLRPATVAARARQRGTRRRRSETKYLGLVASGMSLALAQNVAGIRPLINTGQLLNSVTYVVRSRHGRASRGTFEVI
jgi:hypothetical protein